MRIILRPDSIYVHVCPYARARAGTHALFLYLHLSISLSIYFPLSLALTDKRTKIAEIPPVEMTPLLTRNMHPRARVLVQTFHCPSFIHSAGITVSLSPKLT